MNDLKNKLKLYIENNLIKEEQRKKILIDRDFCYSSSAFNFEESRNHDIEEFINKHEEYNDFQTTLFKLIDSKDLKDSDVYNKVNIDRRLFSKIRSDKNYHPSKETVILLAIALELNEK